jgi:hypothetical protein
MAERYAVPGGRLARRIAEQRQMNLLRDEGEVLANKINSIARWRWHSHGI